jgi:hypothetical protein
VRLVLAFLLSTLAYGQIASDQCKPKIVLTEARVGGVDYQIHFTVPNPCSAAVPATIPPGVPHYDAEIMVYRVTEVLAQHAPNLKDEARLLTPVGKPFIGVYTAGLCYEDKPEYLVKKAEESAKPEGKK